MENQIDSGPHYVAQIKEWQKKAWNCALRSFFPLDLEGIPSDEADNRLLAAWKEYLTTEGLTAQGALKQRNDLLTKYSYNFPYSPGYPVWFGQIWENMSLADMEVMRLSCRPPAAPDPYQTAIIRERISELADEKTPGTVAKIARLEAAIIWLSGPEQRPAPPQSEPALVSSSARPAPAAPLAPTPAAIVRPPLVPAPDGELSANYNPIKSPFTLAHVIELAKAVELIDESGQYASPRGGKGLGAVVGFAQALYDIKVVKSACNRKELVGYLGQLFGVEVRTNGAASIIAKEFMATTKRRAKTLFPDLIKPEKRKESA